MKIFLQHNVLKLRTPLYFGLAIILLNLLSRDFFLRIDLTEDKRHSLSVSTKKFLDNLTESVSIKIYLEGDLPVDYKRFRNSIQEFFDEVNIYCPKVNYEFMDVNDLTVKRRKLFFRKLKKRKLYAKNIFIHERGKRIEKIIFPYARIRANGKEYFVRLLKGNYSNITQQIKQSTEELEYEIMNSIQDMTIKIKKKIGLIRGFGEPKKLYLHGLINTIKKHYLVDFINLSKEQEDELLQFDALVLTNPTKEFSEEAKYLLDQYIMKGGKVLFFISSLKINNRKLLKGLDFAFPSKLNLSDLLFKYGIRVNPDLIQDVNSAYYPIVIGDNGRKPEIKWLKWPFFPILSNFGKHIITKNMGPISAKFISSIDVIKTKDIKKTPLVFSSKHSKREYTPVTINLEELRKEPDLSKFNRGPIPVIYLLEGKFTSLYKNRFIPKNFDENKFIEESKPTKLLIASSGNFVLNEVDSQNNKPIPWGYDFFHKQRFSQGEFFSNTISYMLNEKGLIAARNKNIKLRLLDDAKVKSGYIKWQLINMLVPLFILLTWGLVWGFIYKKRFSKYPEY